ncbi:MAG: DUF2914 domain-containing protein [Myxococcota bacterium]
MRGTTGFVFVIALGLSTAATGVAEMEPMEGAEATTAIEAEASPAGSVARAAVTTSVFEREPTDEVESVSLGTEELFYFTELRDLQGQTVTHRWSQGETIRAEVSFDVGGPRWRVYSRKALLPEWTGEWTLEVVAPSGEVLRSDRFVYEAAEAVPASSDDIR